MKTYRVLQAEIRSLVGKVEVSRIWIIVILVSELTAWLLLGLSNRCEKWGSWSNSEVCVYSNWYDVGERKMQMYLYFICGSLLYDSVGILTEFKVGCCNYVRLRRNPYWDSNQCDTSGISTSKPLGYVTVVWWWIDHYDIMAKEPSGWELCFVIFRVMLCFMSVKH